MLLRVARKRCVTAEDAEDAVQEAMLRASQHPEIADDRLQPWLVAVTTRLCIDGHRRRANEAGRWARAGAQPVVEELGQHPEEKACDRSEAAWVASKATELLPPRQAEALQLTAAGCDVQQVANEMGLNYRAAESLLARARRTLRAALAGCLGAAAWTWRAPATAVSNSGPVALASGALAVIVVTVPIALVPFDLPDVLWPPAGSNQPNPHDTSVTHRQDPGSPWMTREPGGVTNLLPQQLPDPDPGIPPTSKPELGQGDNLSPQQSPLPSGVAVLDPTAPVPEGGQSNQVDPPQLPPPPNLPQLPPPPGVPAAPNLPQPNLPPPPSVPTPPNLPPPPSVPTPPNLPPPPSVPTPPNLPPPPSVPTPPSLPNVAPPPEGPLTSALPSPSVLPSPSLPTAST